MPLRLGKFTFRFTGSYNIVGGHIKISTKAGCGCPILALSLREGVIPHIGSQPPYSLVTPELTAKC